jgi:hypothetical protein
MIRHPKEGRFNSHRVNPRFPPSAPSQWWPTLINVFWVQHETRGNIKRSALGEYSLIGEDTRVETANEGRFSSNVSSEQVDGSQLIDSPREPIYLFYLTELFQLSKRCFISELSFTTRPARRKIRQNWHWQVPFVVFLPKQT